MIKEGRESLITHFNDAINGNKLSVTDYGNIGVDIPLQFRDPSILCIRILPHSKEPPRGKRVEYYSCESPEIVGWVKTGGNVAATSLTGFAVFIDGDCQEVRDAIETHWKTASWNTGKKGHRNYLLFLADEPIDGPIPFRDDKETGESMGYIKSRKGYSVIPPSIHPNGRRYGEEFNDVPVATVRKSELLEALRPFFKKGGINKERTEHNVIPSVGDLRLQDMIDLSGFRFTGKYYQGPHPIHGSSTGSNLEVNTDSNLWYCLRHGTGGSVLEWIAISEGIIECEESAPGALRGMRFWAVIAAAHDRYKLSFNQAAEILKRGEKK